ncbi:MAG: TlpA disulfide reductase family protein [Bacteroidota bacterium]
MKTLAFLPLHLFICAFFCLNGCQQPAVIEDYEIISLPLERVQGYGSFGVSFGRKGTSNMSPQNPWFSTQVEVKGKPKGWEDAHPKQIWFDAQQFAYQNFLQGKIDSSRYADLVESWDIDLDRRPLADRPIRCFTHVVTRMLADSTVEYILDSNNNRDFSDDSIHVAPLLDFEANLDSLAQYALLVEAELWVKGQLQQLNVPIFIRKEFSNNRLYLYYNFPFHYQTQFREQLIQLRGGSGSIGLGYVRLLLGNPQRKLAPKPIEKNEFIRIGEEVFLYKDANTYTQELQLQKMPADTMLYSTQIGFPSKLFQGVTFRGQDTIKLEDYRGKYLLLDFWGSWCQPCVNEMPNMREAFAQLDTSRVSFLGIAQDSRTNLENYLQRDSLPWPQILSTDAQPIVKLYGIDGFPTTILIGPEGNIVEKDLFGTNIYQKIQAYLEEK